MSHKPLTYGSLFAGIGGFDLACDRAGMTCAWQVEIDADARAVLAKHWPDVPKYPDVRECGVHNLTPVDVIVGGFPCQDLSVAGKRAGFDGKRSVLFFEMARIVDELRPAFLVWENVPGLLSSRGGADFWHVLNELDRIGYCGAWTGLDAQWFGVAQRRRRIFGVFARADIGAARCAEILSLPARLSGHPAPRRETREGVAATLRGGAVGGRSRGKPNGSSERELVPVEAEQDDDWPVEVAPTLGTGWGNRHPGTSNQDWISQRGGHFVPAPEPQTFDWQADASGDTSFRGKARSYITDKPGRTRSLTANHTLAVVLPDDTPYLAAPLVARQGKGGFTDPVNDNVIVILQNGSDVQAGELPGALTSAYERGTSGAVIVAPDILSFKQSSMDGRGTLGIDETTQVLQPVKPQGDHQFIVIDDKATPARSEGGQVIAFTSKDCGSDAAEDVAPTLRSMNFAGSHLNGGGQVAIAFESRLARNGRGAPSEIVPPLKAQSGESGKGDAAPLVYYSHDYAQDRIHNPANPAPALAVSPTRQAQSFSATTGIRRLTPVECCRLQGFPDGWNALGRFPSKTNVRAEKIAMDAAMGGVTVEYIERAMSDSVRYRQLGNAVAVPVVEWIMRRLVQVLHDRR